MAETEKATYRNYNPIIKGDYPDPDVIRVEDTYYMLSTTMHFLPGGVILRSYDLVNWEIASYVFDSFGDNEEAKITYEYNSYGCGMWAGCLRYHKGRFYVSFGAKKTEKTYIFSAGNIEGPWERRCIDHYFHDASLFFDDDGRVYLVYGNTEIWIRELLPDLSGVMPEGYERMLVKDTEDVIVGYEGSHFYKINGKYYLFLIHWPRTGTARRTQACFCGDSLDSEFTGGTVLDDDIGFLNCGVAQGGIVEAVDGHWYSILFQDHGAVGRVPVLLPVYWKEGWPVFGENVIGENAFSENGKVPSEISVSDNRPSYKYEPLYTSDNFMYHPEPDGTFRLKKQWQWNHEPEAKLWTILKDGGLRITTGKLSTNVTQAVNTLTQRLMFPYSCVEVTVDAKGLQNGDYAGLCALQGCYGMLAVTRELGRYYLVLIQRHKTEKDRFMGCCDYLPGTVTEKIMLTDARIRLKLEANFDNGTDTVEFYYKKSADEINWTRIGEKHRLVFGLDHFTGCRCGLAVYATKEVGGFADFSQFVFTMREE